MQTNTKAFTLVEMLVAMAVSTIIIAATYASYDLVSTQYKKNIDVAEMNTSGRAVMQMIERDVRMAGFEYRDQDAKVTYGSIAGPLVIKDSGNKCCDEVTVIYDYYDEDSKKVERIRITYSAGPHPRNKGGGDKYDRYRLYKQIDVLGRNNAILANPIIGSKDLLADFVEDFQLINIETSSHLYVGNSGYSVIVVDPVTGKHVRNIDSGGHRPNGGLAFGIKRTGQESLVTINLTFRTRNPYGINKVFKKKDYHGGNFNFDKNDKYKRETFSSKVTARNMVL